VTAQPAAAPARSFVASLGFHADPVVPDGIKTVVNGRLEVDERQGEGPAGEPAAPSGRANGPGGQLGLSSGAL
jgi:hypothetical protein